MLAVLILAAALQITEPVWKDAPPSMPKGTQIAVLEGDTNPRTHPRFQVVKA